MLTRQASRLCVLALQVPISVVNGQFFGTNGQPVTLKGLNWFGFETSATMVMISSTNLAFTFTCCRLSRAMQQQRCSLCSDPTCIACSGENVLN